MEVFNAIWQQIGPLVMYLLLGYLIWCFVVMVLVITIFIFILRRFSEVSKPGPFGRVNQKRGK
jgi:hypothetical protein